MCITRAIGVATAVALVAFGWPRAGADPPDAARMRDLTDRWEVPRTRVLGPFHNLYNARVVDVGGDYRYRMWFFGWTVADYNPTAAGKLLGDAIFHGRSRDLLHWEVYAGRDAAGRPTWDASGDAKTWVPVLTEDRSIYGSAAVGDPSVVRRGGVYTMAFSSVGFEVRRDEKPERMYLVPCIMAATSKDGIDWRRSVAPILMWGQELTVRQEAGNPNIPAGYCGSYHRPSLMWDRGRWRLWFDYFLPGTFVSMGYAECRGDPMKPADWKVVRSGGSPLLRDWPNPSVVKVGGFYYAFSDAPGYPADMGGDTRVLTMARSKDGLEWTVMGHLRPEGRASAHVPEAFVRRENDGEWLYLFYAWKPETPKGGPWDYRYKEIRYMRIRTDRLSRDGGR